MATIQKDFIFKSQKHKCAASQIFPFTFMQYAFDEPVFFCLKKLDRLVQFIFVEIRLLQFGRKCGAAWKVQRQIGT